MTVSTTRGRVSTPLVVIIVALILIVGLIALQRQSGNRRSLTDKNVVSAEGSNGDTRSTSISSLPGKTGKSSSSTPSVRDNDSSTAVSAEPTPAEREDGGPVSFLIEDFRNYQKQITAYKLDGLEQTAEGIKLAPAKDDVTTTDGQPAPRIGTLESPVLTLYHPSSVVAPLWRNTLPADTSMQVEIALSADQEKWSQWYPIEPTGDQIEPNYPDGRPNPNYGSVGGSSVANGLDLYPYIRYRVTLASGSKESPVLQEFRVFHTDSTDGLGQIAGQGTPYPDTPTGGAPTPQPQ